MAVRPTGGENKLPLATAHDRSRLLVTGRRASTPEKAYQTLYGPRSKRKRPMTLGDLIRNVENAEKTLTVYGSEAAAAEVREYFASQHVTVEAASSSGARDGFVVLSETGHTLAAVDIDDLHGSLTAGVGEKRAFSEVLEHLDDLTFSAYDPTQMLATTREIEDRAWRAGSGHLHAGFQRMAAFDAQRSTYRDLASTGLDIDVYVRPGSVAKAPAGVTLHANNSEEIARTWFVAFDGDGVDAEKCALLAEERGDRTGEERERRFYGVWTYDPELVDATIDYLDATYLDATADDHDEVEPTR